MDKPKKTISPEKAKIKAAAYCAYQERTQQQVRDKLYSYGLWEDVVEEILTALILDNFVNEERFAKSFVSGKFRLKKWGRRKILMRLKQHHLSAYCVKKGMEEIDPDEYQNTLEELITKKVAFTTEADVFKRNGKIARYLVGKGYEESLIWEAIKNRESR